MSPGRQPIAESVAGALSTVALAVVLAVIEALAGDLARPTQAGVVVLEHRPSLRTSRLRTVKLSVNRLLMAPVLP